MTTFAYNPTTGRLASRTDPDGRTITYAYDADNHLTAVTAPDGSGSTFVYDAFGRLVGADNATTPVALAYDGAGSLISQTTGGGASAQPSVTLTYGHDPAGNRTSLTGPAGTTTYSYNSQSQLTALSNPAVGTFGFGYNTGQALVTMSRPNGVTDGSTYDATGNLLSRVSTSGATTVGASSYTLGPSELVASGPAGSFSYDNANQLTGVTPPSGPAQSYTYDSAGNQLSSPNAASMTYNTSDQLTAVGTTAYGYNGEGEETSVTPTAGTPTSYTWNDMGLLVSASTPVGLTTYKYDALGRRVEVDAPGGQVTRYVDDGTNPVATYNGTNVLQASWVNGIGMHTPLEMTSAGQHYYYLSDAEGSVTALTNAAGTAVERYSYDAFGKATSSGASLPNPFTYTGQAYDASDGLYYEGARYYDPTISRFLSPDPAMSANPYPYVGNNPTNFTDPTGAEAMIEDAEISVLNQQVKLGEEIQKLVACISGQMLYIVLAMRGFAVSPPSLQSQLNTLLPGMLTDAAENQIGNLLSNASSALEESDYADVAAAANNSFPYLTKPADAGKTFVTQVAGKLAPSVGLPESLPDFVSTLLDEGKELGAVALAAEAAANGTPDQACEAIKKLCEND